MNHSIKPTILASNGPPGAVVREPSSWFLYNSGMVTSTSDTRTMSLGTNGWNWICLLRLSAKSKTQLLSYNLHSLRRILGNILLSIVVDILLDLHGGGESGLQRSSAK